jgi:hypothetical protein
MVLRRIEHHLDHALDVAVGSRGQIETHVSRYDPTDFEWRVIEPLPPSKPRGDIGSGLEGERW